MGRAVKLRPWQKRDICKIYDNPAGTRTAILSFARKNGKTALAAFLLLLHLAGPESVPNTELYSAATSRDQAAVLFTLASKCVRLSPTLSEFVAITDSSKILACPELGTKYQALSAEDKTAHGRSPVFAVHDELGQVRGPRSALYSTIETGMGAHEAPLSIVISTQASSDDDLMSILIDDALKGDDPSTVVSLYSAPDDVDPFSDEALQAANPAYGDFLNPKTLDRERDKAERLPSQEAFYRNLHLNQRIEANSPYISRSVWDACGGVLDGWGEEAFGGLDLSAVNDLTAFVRVSWVNSVLQARATFWLPENGIEERARKDRVPYDVWAKEGLINLVPGGTVDYDYVAPVVLRAIKQENIVKVAFDRWNMRYFRPCLERAGASLEELELFQEFGQGFKSMSPALRGLDQVLLNQNLRHGSNPVLTMCAANAVVKSDPAGNRKLDKAAPTRRIDGAVALAMASAMAGEPREAVPVTPWDDDPSYRLAG